MAKTGDRSDAELVQGSRAGDADAYKELVVRYQGHVYGMAYYSIVGDWAEAQDIAQETFVRVHLNLDQLRDPTRFAPWLRRVAFSATMNWLRQYRPQSFARMEGRVDLDSLELPDFRPGPAELVERRELADAVMAAVQSLPPRYRLPLTMFHLDGLSYQKVADFLDIPLGTARSLIHRARKKLAAALGAALAEEASPMVKEVFDQHRLPADFAGKVIHGLERTRWGAGERENSPLGALAAALAAVGENVSYEFLMGVSGAAFRVQMMRPDWCSSAPHPRCGHNCLDHAFDALAWELVDLPVQRGDSETIEQARRAVVESIDSGVPAFYTSLEESLIVGYQDDGRRLLLRLYGAGDEGYALWSLDRSGDDADEQYPESFVFDWPHLSLGVLRRKEQAADRRASLVRSLELARELANTSEAGPYASGFAAYDFWIAALRDDARYRDAEAREAAMRANAHCYYSL